MDVRVGLWRKLSTEELMLLNCGVGEDSWESLGLQGDPISPFWRRSALGFLWREWCWSWNSSTLATWWEELTHWKRLWCWEGLGAVGEGDDRGWDDWMASLTWWTWVWVNSGSWWWTRRPGMLRFMESRRVGHDWTTELNWIQQSLEYKERLKHMWTKLEIKHNTRLYSEGTGIIYLGKQILWTISTQQSLVLIWRLITFLLLVKNALHCAKHYAKYFTYLS